MLLFRITRSHVQVEIMMFSFVVFAARVVIMLFRIAQIALCRS